jgi:hypothetical protein
VWLSADKVSELASDPYLLALLMWLKANNGPTSVFWIADGLARQKALDEVWVVQVSKPSPGHHAEYVWGVRA